MGQYSTVGQSLRVASPLLDLVERRILPGTSIAPETFWSGLEAIVRRFAPRNRRLLNRRYELQLQIDRWHRDRSRQSHDAEGYRQFLIDIGYLVPEPADFQILTTNVDSELAEQAGPQLVVPVNNARYALSAANARCGSLFDALYGTDAIPEDEGGARTGDYNPIRGRKVIAYARTVLDEAAPLARGRSRTCCRLLRGGRHSKGDA
jgi:malate synthase